MYPHSMLGESHNCWCFQYIIHLWQGIPAQNNTLCNQTYTWKNNENICFFNLVPKLASTWGAILFVLYEGLFIIWLMVVNNHRCKHLWNNFFLKQHFKSELGDCKKLHNETQWGKQLLELNNFKILLKWWANIMIFFM